MTSVDPGFVRGIQAFLMPTLMGALCYCAATFVARLLSSVPRHRYEGRLSFMLVVLLVWWLLYAPRFAYAFASLGQPQYRNGLWPEALGTQYGLHTIWSRCAAVLLPQWAWKRRVSTAR